MTVHTIQFNMGDWLGGTLGWDALECGAYFNLLIAHYQIGLDGLPNSSNTLAKYAKCSPKVWKRISTKIMTKFYLDGDHWKNDRVLKTLNKITKESPKSFQDVPEVIPNAAQNICNPLENKEKISPNTIYNIQYTESNNNLPRAREEKKVTLDELSTDHIAAWLSKKRSEGRFLHHDPQQILEKFRDYCKSKGKRYVDYVAAYRNAFDWERCQPTKSGGKHAKTGYSDIISAGIRANATEERRREPENYTSDRQSNFSFAADVINDQTSYQRDHIGGSYSLLQYSPERSARHVMASHSGSR